MLVEKQLFCFPAISLGLKNYLVCLFFTVILQLHITFISNSTTYVGLWIPMLNPKYQNHEFLSNEACPKFLNE